MRSAFVLAGVVFGAMASPGARAQFVEGDLYVGSFDDKIYRVDPTTWTVTDFADHADLLNGASAVAFSPAGTLLCSNYYSSEVREFDSNGDGSLLYDATAGVSGPFGENGLAWDAGGDLYVSCFLSNQILRFPANGSGPTVFVDGGDGIVRPDGLAFDANGDLLVANRESFTILKIDPSGAASLFDTLPEDPYSIVVRSNGDLYVACCAPGSTPDVIYRYPSGDASQRAPFATTSAFMNPALQFDPHEDWLYFTSYDVGNLVQIDPDTGSWTEVLPSGSLSGALSLAFFGGSGGRYLPYGTGKTGNGGFVPTLDGIGTPDIGTRSTLQIRDFVGGAPGLFVVSGASDHLTAFGGTIYVSFAAPHFVLPIVLPGAPGVAGDGDVDLDADVPDDSALVGLHAYLQVLAVDRSVAFKVTMTNGLDVLIGD